MNVNGSKLCGCGCNQRISANKEFKFGHVIRVAEPAPMKTARKPRAKKEATAEKPKAVRKPRTKKTEEVPA
jgi:hypothetical protein